MVRNCDVGSSVSVAADVSCNLGYMTFLDNCHASPCKHFVANVEIPLLRQLHNMYVQHCRSHLQLQTDPSQCTSPQHAS